MTTLLAVDDSKTMRKAIEITFAGEDYQTILAATAEDALAKVRSDRPDLVLVDHDLGGESGYDLCQRIKSESPSTRVLILSSKQHPYDASRGSAAGADEHMDKPFDTQQIIDRVSQMLKAAPAQASGPMEGVTAPAPAPHLAAKPRSPTLAYGTPAPTSPAAVPQASQPPQARAHTFTGTPRPAPAVAPKPTFAATPPAPAVSPAAVSAAPAPRAAAPVAAAPAAAPIAAAPIAVAPVAVAAPAAAAPAAAVAIGGQLAGKLEGLGLSPAQVEAVLALSREVVEQVVWEVVPVLAETLIQEEIQRLTQA